jgi:hypothetical protein
MSSHPGMLVIAIPLLRGTNDAKDKGQKKKPSKEFIHDKLLLS